MVDVLVLTPDDWQLWRQLRLAALAEAPDAFGATLAEWSGSRDAEQRWRDRLANVPLNLVLTVDGEPIGMVSATAPNVDGEVELIGLWVAPSGRGRGVGSEAVQQVAAWARAEHPGRALVLSVKRDNRAARALYERHGFVNAGPSPDDPDEQCMRRSVF
ncbi:MAG: GNAT family N-acetyltransferase [Actinomycetota bacterium]|nr:GNAT family N-acetyltransferase [Actinomycetota bacterium]